MANVVAGLGAQLGLDTTEFQKGISEAKESTMELKESLIKILEVTAFAELTKQAMEYANTIVTTAKANDVAVASVLELSKALEENGGDAENTGKIYSGFSQKIEAAAQGNAKAQESFARLGVSLNDLAHLSTQDLFEKTINGLAKMKDAAERNGLAMQTLGKGIKGVDINGLAHDLEEGKGSMDKYSEAVEKAHELSLKLDAASKQFTLSFTNAVIPQLLELYEVLHKDGTALQFFFDLLSAGADIVAVLVKGFVTSIMTVVDMAKFLGSAIKDAFTLNFKEIATDFTAMTDSIKKRLQEDVDFQNKIFHIGAENQKKPEAKPVDAVNRNIIASNQKQIDSAKELAALYQKQADTSLLILTTKLQDNNATKNQKEMADELMKVVEARNKALDDIDKRESGVDKTTESGKALIKVLEEQRAKIQDVYSVMIAKSQEAVEANQKLQESFMFGWDKAFAQYKENADTMANVGKRAFDDISSALEKFVSTGKLNFKSLAQSIIQDIIKIQIQAQISKMISGFSFSSLFSGGSVNMGTATGADLGAAFADGGDPPVGKASLVGEQGPELFIPKTSGTIIPNNKLGGLGGATTNNVTNNYIQAIDTQSFEQRLYGSSQAIWAANQYATKNLATNRART